MLLTKEQILTKELVQENFDCTPYGLEGEVIIQELTVDDRDTLELSVVQGDKINLKNLRAKTLALSCVDGEGNKIFSLEDAQAIGKISGRMMVEMYRVAKRLSGLGEDEVKALVKKSEPNA